MTLPPAHLVGIGGAIGAVLRHYAGVWIRHDRLPFDTFGVNVAGSFLLGVVTFGAVPSEVGLLVGTGACGAFTTYSSFSFETVRLWEAGERARAALYAGGTFGCCLGAAALAAGLVGILAG